MKSFFTADINEDLSVSVNLLKHLYMSMLLELPKSKILDFWNQHPLVMSELTFSGRELLESLWSSQTPIPLKYQLEVFNSFEDFLVELKIDLPQFLDSFYNKVYKGRFHSANSWLLILKPYFRQIFQEEDLRHWLLQHFNEFNEEFYKHSGHEIVLDEIKGQMRKSLMLYCVDNASGLPLDYETWVLPWLVQCPNVFGMNSYEYARMVADSRSINQLLDVDIQGDQVFFEGEQVGTVVSFNQWLEQYDIDLAYLKLPSTECVLVSQDIKLASGKELHSNCLYGAPVYLTEFNYRKNQKAPENPMADLIDAVVREEEQLRAEISQIHFELLDELLPRFEIQFYNTDEAISINGTHFVRNVPAKIFHKIIQAYLLEGRTEFEHREFKRDPEICMDQANPNFEGRLARLMKKLETEYPNLKIEKSGRGVFKFNPNAIIEIRNI